MQQKAQDFLIELNFPLRWALEDLCGKFLKRYARREFVFWMCQRNYAVSRNSVAGILDMFAVQFGINRHVVANFRERAVFVGAGGQQQKAQRNLKASQDLALQPRHVDANTSGRWCIQRSSIMEEPRAAHVLLGRVAFRGGGQPRTWVPRRRDLPRALLQNLQCIEPPTTPAPHGEFAKPPRHRL